MYLQLPFHKGKEITKFYQPWLYALVIVTVDSGSNGNKIKFTLPQNLQTVAELWIKYVTTRFVLSGTVFSTALY
jgi:hypothetical protein